MKNFWWWSSIGKGKKNKTSPLVHNAMKGEEVFAKNNHFFGGKDFKTVDSIGPKN